MKRCGDPCGVDGSGGRSGAITCPGHVPVVSEAVGPRRGSVCGDGALVDEPDGIVAGSFDVPGVAVDGDAGGDGEILGGGSAVGAVGVDTVGRARTEDDLSGAGNRLGATVETVEGDGAGVVAAAVADADFCAVEGQAAADRDRATGNVEVAGERNAGEGAAAGGCDELGGACGLDTATGDGASADADRAGGVVRLEDGAGIVERAGDVHGSTCAVEGSDAGGGEGAGEVYDCCVCGDGTEVGPFAGDGEGLVLGG